MITRKPGINRTGESSSDTAGIWRRATGEMVVVVAIVATAVSTVIYAVLERFF